MQGRRSSSNLQLGGDGVGEGGGGHMIERFCGGLGTWLPRDV